MKSLADCAWAKQTSVVMMPVCVWFIQLQIVWGFCAVRLSVSVHGAETLSESFSTMDSTTGFLLLLCLPKCRSNVHLPFAKSFAPTFTSVSSGEERLVMLMK